MILLKNITVKYNTGTDLEKTVISNLSLNVNKNELLGIIGSNGAGKSTLLKVITGEIQNYEGEVIINNKNYNDVALVKRSAFIGRVFQDPNLGTAPKLTIFENMLFAYYRNKKRLPYLMSDSSKKLKEMFITKLAFINMGLENKLEQKVMYLSGGQRQALSLIMATLTPSKLLVLDEHTSALDPATKNVIMKLTLDIIKRDKITAIMITHDMEEAKLCDRILKLQNNGTIELI